MIKLETKIKNYKDFDVLSVSILSGSRTAATRLMKVSSKEQADFITNLLNAGAEEALLNLVDNYIEANKK